MQPLALTDSDRQMRDCFCRWCSDAGLQVTIDAIGNIHARRDGSSDLPPVMVGSHLDTQVAGGRYDGALGVLTGLEIVRWLDDLGAVTRRPVEVVAWSNEEGARFSPPMLGSAAYVGALPLTDALARRDSDGHTFGEELARISYDGEPPLPCPPPAAYFEFHIEQDRLLHDSGVDLGIVTATYASRGVVLRLVGETGHAGSTPMHSRRDAFAAAAETALALERLAPADGVARATIPSIEVWPNRPGIIPGEVTLTVDFRHVDGASADALGARFMQEAQSLCDRRGVELTRVQSWSFGDAVTLNADLATGVRDLARQLDVSVTDMTSTAGHDAYWLAAVAPTALVFVPCVDGITHNEREAIDYDRVARGANVFAHAVVEAADR